MCSKRPIWVYTTHYWQARRCMGRDSHIENFIRAVRSRKVSDLNADVEAGHHSAVLCHMANIAMRVGRRLRFDTWQERFIDDAEANAYLTKKYRKGYELPSL